MHSFDLYIKTLASNLSEDTDYMLCVHVHFWLYIKSKPN